MLKCYFRSRKITEIFYSANLDWGYNKNIIDFSLSNKPIITPIYWNIMT